MDNITKKIVLNIDFSNFNKNGLDGNKQIELIKFVSLKKLPYHTKLIGSVKGDNSKVVFAIKRANTFYIEIYDFNTNSIVAIPILNDFAYVGLVEDFKYDSTINGYRYLETSFGFNRNVLKVDKEIKEISTAEQDKKFLQYTNFINQQNDPLKSIVNLNVLGREQEYFTKLLEILEEKYKIYCGLISMITLFTGKIKIDHSNGEFMDLFNKYLKSDIKHPIKKSKAEDKLVDKIYNFSLDETDELYYNIKDALTELENEINSKNPFPEFEKELNLSFVQSLITEMFNSVDSLNG